MRSLNATRRWAAPAGLAAFTVAVTIAVAGCGGADGRPDGDTGAGRGHQSEPASRSASQPGPEESGLSATEIDELEKVVSGAEGAANEVERDGVEP